MLTDLLFFVAQPGNLPPQFAAPAAAAAPGPGGTTPGYVPTSAQAAQALKQQTAELKKFWREQQAEIEQVSSALEVSLALALVVTHSDGTQDTMSWPCAVLPTACLCLRCRWARILRNSKTTSCRWHA